MLGVHRLAGKPLPLARCEPRLHYFNSDAKRCKRNKHFCDESGSFSPDVLSSRYYLVCMVFHNQSEPVSEDIARLDETLQQLEIPQCHNSGIYGTIMTK